VGALPEIVEPGVTGFLVDDIRQMAEAIHAVETLEPERCREVARQRFSLERMIAGYFNYYWKVAAAARILQ
jgi:glycosyltransferase involved in cell wall biosynthesis